MHCEGKWKLRSHNTSYCLIELITKASVTIYVFINIWLRILTVMLRCRSKRKVLFQNIVMTRITGLWWHMQQYFNYHSRYICSGYGWGCRGCDRMLVGLITTYAVNGYHHSCCEFESRSCEVYPIQHYVIKLVSDLRQVDGFLWVLWFPLPLKLTATI